MFKVILLGVMFVMFGSATFAAGGGGGGGGGGGSGGGSSSGSGGNAVGKSRDQTYGTPADKSGIKKQDKDRIHTPGTGTGNPAATPSADKTGIKKQDQDRIHTPGTGTATPAVVPVTN